MDAFFNFLKGYSYWSLGLANIFEALCFESDSDLDHCYLAEEMMSRRKPRSAIRHYYQALALAYAYADKYDFISIFAPDLHNGTGRALIAVGDFASASEHLYIASELKPDDTKFRADYEACRWESLPGSARAQTKTQATTPLNQTTPPIVTEQGLSGSMTSHVPRQILVASETDLEKELRHRKLDRAAAVGSVDSNVKETDFPKQPGRNDPCPCGSGKKYKKCHGAAG